MRAQARGESFWSGVASMRMPRVRRMHACTRACSRASYMQSCIHRAGFRMLCATGRGQDGRALRQAIKRAACLFDAPAKLTYLQSCHATMRLFRRFLGAIAGRHSRAPLHQIRFKFSPCPQFTRAWHVRSAAQTDAEGTWLGHWIV